MIFNLSGGGGASLNFKMVGNPKPETSSENTIWLNTDKAIGGYVLGPDEPTSKEPGTAWIRTGLKGATQFNALKKDAIIICPVAASMCNENGVYESLDAQIYQSDTGWINFTSIYLYNNGDTTGYRFACTGKLKQYDYGYASTNKMTESNGQITVTNSGSSGFTDIFVTDDAGEFITIDVSRFTTLKIKGTLSGATKATACVLRFLTAIEGNVATDNINAFTRPIYTTELNGEMEIDISSVTGTYYIGFTFYGEATTLTLTETVLA